MDMLKSFTTMDQLELFKKVRESLAEERMAMERKGLTVPDAHGNRRQRRAAVAIARRQETVS